MEAFIPDFMTTEDLNGTSSSSSSSFSPKHHNNPSYKQKYDIPNTSAIMDEEETDLDNDSEENMIDNSSSSSSNSEEHDEYDTASLTMKASTATTTTTPATTTTTTTTPYPPLQIRQFHCRGEGLPGRTTRWTALASPSCRGKWLRLTLDTPKKCSHPQFAFV